MKGSSTKGRKGRRQVHLTALPRASSEKLQTLKDVRHSQSQPSLHQSGLRRSRAEMTNTIGPSSAQAMGKGSRKNGAPIGKELTSALKELKSVKSNYKAMSQRVEPYTLEDEDSIRQRLLCLSRQAEDGLRTLQQKETDNSAQDPTTQAKLDVAETVMRKLYKRNMELERMVKEENHGHPPNTHANQALSKAFDELKRKSVQQSHVVQDQERTIQQLQAELRSAQRQVATLEAAISRQMNSNIQKQLKHSQESLERQRQETEYLREEFESLIDKGIGTFTDDDTSSPPEIAQVMLEGMRQRMKQESLEREADVVIWNQRLYTLEREAEDLYAEKRFLEQISLGSAN